MKNELTGKYEGYIYCINNTINFKSYIGQTIRTIESRFKSHKTNSKNIKRSIYLYGDTNLYGWDVFAVSQIEKIVCNTEDELKQKLDEKEIFYIKKYNTLYPNGYNISKGGWLLPNRFDSVVVYKFDLDGNLVQSYSSISDAALNNNVSQADISNCCNGKKVATVGGFYWSKSKDFVLPNIQKQKKRIVMIDKNGKLIREFDSATDAAIIFFGDKKKRTGISKCLAKESKTAYGYRWEYYKGDNYGKTG